MKKSIQSTNLFFRKWLAAIGAVAIILILALLMFKKINFLNSQSQITASSSGMVVVPTVNITPASSSTPYPKNFPQLSVSIDQIETFQDTYFIKGTLHQSDITNGGVDSVDVANMILTDTAGEQIPIEPLYFGINADNTTTGLEFSFYTRKKAAPGMLTLTVSSAEFSFSYSFGPNQISGPSFEVDFGDNPQENQEWPLIGDFILAGHPIRLSSVKTLIQNGVPFVEFRMTGGTDFTGALVLDTDMQSYDSDTVHTSFQDGQIITLFKYPDGFPKGKRQFAFMSISFNAQGNWQISFDPASIDKQPSKAYSEFHNACFLNENWMNRESISKEIPSRLSGTLFIDNEFTGLISPSIATIDLKSGEKQNILPLLRWFPDAFSPDGTAMIQYDQRARSAYISNLQNGEVKEYVWNKTPSNRISWLSGSDLIAYDCDDGIYISQVDGTGIFKVNKTDGDTLLGGWLPDGQHILVSRKGYKKPMLLQILDVHSGEGKDLFSFSSSYDVAALPSPDGKKVLFDDGVIGTQQQGIFVSDLDGSERHLIASFWPMLIGSYTWSPDGKWVIISVTDVKHDSEITNFLISPDSCETIQLSNIDWAVRAWGGLP